MLVDLARLRGYARMASRTGTSTSLFLIKDENPIGLVKKKRALSIPVEYNVGFPVFVGVMPPVHIFILNQKQIVYIIFFAKKEG
jgi:hypothetical protein